MHFAADGYNGVVPVRFFKGGKFMAKTAPKGAIAPKKRGALYYLRRDLFFYALVALPLLYYLVYKYLPMLGIVIAFEDYKPFLGLAGVFKSKWVGLKHFNRFFSSAYFTRLVCNTFLISLYDLIFSFPAAIILALLLNEVRVNKFKRVVQTVSYLPHFLSSVIVCGMLRQLLSVDGGLINGLICSLGGDPIYFLGSSQYYRAYYTASSVWQSMGWNSIIYLAAISGIDPGLYEAAEIDGATTFKKMWYITLPSLLPIISIMLIMRVGSLLSVGYEKTLLLYSPLIYDVADIISTYVYREGLLSMEYSYSTAVGLFTSVISLVMVLFSNWASHKMGQEGVW